MPEEGQNSKVTQLPNWAAMVMNLSWIEIAGETWKIGRKALHGLANEGIYEGLDYETNLEL